MRGRSPEHGGEPLVFDLEFDGEGFSGDDVAFRSPMPPARRKALIGAGVVGVVLFGVVVARLGADDSPDAAPSTSTTVAETSTTARRPASTVARSTTTTAAYVPAAPFATDPGYRVFLFDGNGNGSTSIVDLTTGERTSQAGYLPFVVSTSAGPRFLNWSEAAASDGTVWWVENTNLIASGPDGDRTEEAARIPLSAAFNGSEIIGVDSAGRPVLRGPDLGGYAIGADGRAERILEGAILSVSPSGSVAVRCTVTADCELATSVPGAVTVPVASAYGPLAYGARPSVSPDGRWLGLQDSELATTGLAMMTTRLIDLTTGASVELGSETQMYGSFAAVGWSPDSRFCFYVTNFELRAYELATGTVHQVLTSRMNGYSVAGVG